jgi:hypothetical protein
MGRMVLLRQSRDLGLNLNKVRLYNFVMWYETQSPRVVYLTPVSFCNMFDIRRHLWEIWMTGSWQRCTALPAGSNKSPLNEDHVPMKLKSLLAIVQNSRYSSPRKRQSSKVGEAGGILPTQSFCHEHTNKLCLSCGGTICLQSNHWNNPAFPKPLIYDCINTRKGLLMHNKVSAPFPPWRLPIANFLEMDLIWNNFRTTLSWINWLCYAGALREDCAA